MPNILTYQRQRKHSGFIKGGPKLAEMLRRPDPNDKPSWIRNQRPKRRCKILRWLQV